jgi:UDP-glucose-4-epimerase GalE
MAALILVTGGAGYIGSHTVLALREAGFETLVVDDFSEGHRAAVGDSECATVNLLDAAALREVCRQRRIAAAVHFAARCYVGESVRDPSLYYHNNVVGTLNLVEALAGTGVRGLVFSSSCATYGEPASVPIGETCPQQPVNAYGRSKLASEFVLRDFARAHGLASVALRYFNAAGADPGGRLGEDHRPETHLVPLVLAAAAGRNQDLRVFGNDYPTPDGTCVRDYVHVSDLAAAHVLAVRSLLDGETGFRAYNLGNSVGTSVFEIVRACERITGRAVPFTVGPRRPGDPAVLVGSTVLAAAELGWRPQRSDVESIVATAWAWYERHPDGYR